MGAVTFRLTRESVQQGVMAGLTGEAIIARLEKLTGAALAQNVATQVRTWAGRVRQVGVQTALLVRCPDADTAARVLSVLGKKAERLTDTVLTLFTDKGLSAAQRKKLLEEGIQIAE